MIEALIVGPLDPSIVALSTEAARDRLASELRLVEPTFVSIDFDPLISEWVITDSKCEPIVCRLEVF